MNEKVMVNEKLKCILYTIFSNYNNLSKKIYIVLDDSKNSEKMSEDILKKINQNTPYFIKKILANFNNENDNSVLKLKKSNQYLEIVDKNQNTEGESILLDMSSLDFNDIERKCDYEVKFVVDYIFNLDEIGKSRFFKEVEKTIEKDKSKKEEFNNNLDINYLYNICISKYMWKDSNDAAKMENWIYNIINPNRLHSDLLEKMIEIINKELNNLNFDSYLRYILSKEENKLLNLILDNLVKMKEITVRNTTDKITIDFLNNYLKAFIFKSGTWLEIETNKLINKIDEIDESKNGVMFLWNDSKEIVRNEVDVVAVKDSVPIFISCKDSDKYNEMALNELNVYAEKFGGDNSYKILVATKAPIKSPVKIRAKEMGINIIIFDGNEEKFLKTIKSIIK